MPSTQITESNLVSYFGFQNQDKICLHSMEGSVLQKNLPNSNTGSFKMRVGDSIRIRGYSSLFERRKGSLAAILVVSSPQREPDALLPSSPISLLYFCLVVQDVAVI